MNETKRCCGYRGEWACVEDYPDHVLPIELFSFEKSKPSGRFAACKACQKLRDAAYNAKISAARKLVGSQKSFRSMTREERDEIYAQLDGNIVDIKPKLKSEFGESTPMTKRKLLRLRVRRCRRVGCTLFAIQMFHP